MKTLRIPEKALVVAWRRNGGSSGAFLRRAVPETEILSATPFRIEFSDDPSSPEAKRGAFETLKRLVSSRLSNGTAVSVDAEGLRDDQVNQLRNLSSKGWLAGLRVDLSDATGEDLEIERTKSSTDRRADHGPFDIVGDVHGCMDELTQLLDELGYRVTEEVGDDGERRFRVFHPEGRRLAFLGDLADRGPDGVGCFALAMDAVQSGAAVWTIGNHDWKAQTWIESGKGSDRHGFQLTREGLEAAPARFRARLREVLAGLPSHLVLSGGELVIAHAGCLEVMQGKDSRHLTAFCMFGATTGETDSNGFPVREDWAPGYHGRALVVHGHTPVQEPSWGVNGNVLCVDTGCAFGGALTALRWPEMELRSVPAQQVYHPHPEIEPRTSIRGPGPG